MLDKTKIEKNTINDQPTGDSDPAVEAMALRHAYIEVNCEPPSFTIDETNVDSLIADLELDQSRHAKKVLAWYAFKLPEYQISDLIYEQSVRTVESDLAEIKMRYAQERRRKAFGVVTRIAGILSPRPRTP